MTLKVRFWHFLTLPEGAYNQEEWLILEDLLNDWVPKVVDFNPHDFIVKCRFRLVAKLHSSLVLGGLSNFTLTLFLTPAHTPPKYVWTLLEFF